MSPLITGITPAPITGATVQFVDSITETAGIRLDLNDLEPFMVSTVDLSPPAFRRATSSSMLTDGERVTASAYSNRTIKLTLQLATDVAYDSTTAAAALSALARELDRPSNILRVQLNNSATFFRTYRSPDFVLAMLNGNIDYSGQDISIVAEPFGLTPAVSMTDGPIVGNSFGAADIQGDVETPLQILFPGNLGGHRMMISTRRGGDPDALGAVLQMEAETLALFSSVTIAATHDPNMSGSGPNYVRADLSAYSPGVMVGLVIASPFLTVPNDARGRYRLFLRYRKSTSTAGDFLIWASFGGQLTDPFVTLPSTAPQLVSLGLFSSPGGPDPVEDGNTGITMPVISQNIEIYAARLSGSGTLDLDYLLLQPADDHCTVIDWTTQDPSAQNIVDGPNRTAYSATLDGLGRKTVVQSSHILRSAPPMVSPGVKNRVWVLPNIKPDEILGDDVTAVVSITDAVYWPRYLTLAP